MVGAMSDPSACGVPVIVTVWLSCRSPVEPSTCFWMVTVGPKVTFTSQLVLVTAIDVPARLAPVPRATLWAPTAGVAPGEGQAAPSALPPVNGFEAPVLLARAPAAHAPARTLFWPPLYPPHNPTSTPTTTPNAT